ncbi:hypothetical protein P9250_25430 [Caballeronia sp. LP006]|nr:MULTISPECIES: hypothetical protein [unclassified Caballeronia]MDR5805197.1 hypothetical protein [Caballeronia sp. LZ001]MDR5831221.1 hypothetical protein [Caballeronia sp. LP006]
MTFLPEGANLRRIPRRKLGRAAHVDDETAGAADSPHPKKARHDSAK